MKPSNWVRRKTLSESIGDWMRIFFGLIAVLMILIIILFAMNLVALPAHDQRGAAYLNYRTPPGSQQSFADPGRQLRRL